MSFDTDALDPPIPDEVIEKLRELVDGDAGTKLDASTLRICASALVGQLKALSRDANLVMRARKEKTAAARQEMDQAHLQLQNLQYEKRHLEREIEKCRQFASMYQDIPLYSLEEFEKLAPEEARIPVVLADEHQLMLNRLSFELAERQRLEQRRKELAQEKEELLKQSRTNATTSDNVKSQIETLIKTAAEVQKKVDQLVQPASAPAPAATTD